MAKTYSVKEVENLELETTYYWIIETTTRFTIFGTFSKEKIIGKYIDPHAGFIPFFSIEAVNRRIKNLENG